MAGSIPRQPLFWCQALYLLHSSSRLTRFCISIDCVITHQQGLQVLLCYFHAVVCIATNLHMCLTTFCAQSLRIYQVISKPKQTQIPLGWSPQYGPSRPAADVWCSCCYRTAAARMAYVYIVCEHVLHTMKSHVHAHA